MVKVWLNRELAYEMVKRELLSINKGSILGFSWLIISPLLQAAGYLIITSGLFHQKIGVASQIQYLLVGVGTWQVFSRVLAEAPTFIISRMDIIKQVYFPIEILPLPRIFSTLISCSFMYLIALIFSIYYGSYSPKILLLPLSLLLSCLFLITFSWTLCVAGVIMRDLRELMTISMSFLIFASPAIFPPNGPNNAILQQVMVFNPLTPFIQTSLWCFGAAVTPLAWLNAIIVTVTSILIGSKVLNIAKNKVAEMI